jgi:DNA-binding FadR family transcriptional regulator
VAGMTEVAVPEIELSADVDSSQRVLESIWDLVRQRGLSVGDQLPSIRELAQRLDVKSTVVRDALLEARGLGTIKILPRAGAFLCAPPPRTSTSTTDEPTTRAFRALLANDDQNLFHILDARRFLEIELVGRAADRRRIEDLLPVRTALEAMLQLPDDASRAECVPHDIRFHVEIARLSGNEVLAAMQRALMESLRSPLLAVPLNLQRRETTDASHLAIYEALVAGNAEKARHEMRQHLSLAYDSLLHDVQTPPSVRRG